MYLSIYESPGKTCSKHAQEHAQSHALQAALFGLGSRTKGFSWENTQSALSMVRNSPLTSSTGDHAAEAVSTTGAVRRDRASSMLPIKTRREFRLSSNPSSSSALFTSRISKTLFIFHRSRTIIHYNTIFKASRLHRTCAAAVRKTSTTPGVSEPWRS